MVFYNIAFSRKFSIVKIPKDDHTFSGFEQNSGCQLYCLVLYKVHEVACLNNFLMPVRLSKDTELSGIPLLVMKSGRMKSFFNCPDFESTERDSYIFSLKLVKSFCS